MSSHIYIEHTSSPPFHSQASTCNTSLHDLLSPGSSTTSRKRSFEATTSSNRDLSDGKDITAPLLLHKKPRVLKTSFNRKETSDEVKAYMEKQVLHLARLSREVYCAKIHYQRLRMRELEMMRSILQDELEVSEVSLSDTERQIGEIRQQLFGEGGTSGDNGSTEQWTRILQVQDDYSHATDYGSVDTTSSLGLGGSSSPLRCSDANSDTSESDSESM